MCAVEKRCSGSVNSVKCALTVNDSHLRATSKWLRVSAVGRAGARAFWSLPKHALSAHCNAKECSSSSAINSTFATNLTRQEIAFLGNANRWVCTRIHHGRPQETSIQKLNISSKKILAGFLESILILNSLDLRLKYKKLQNYKTTKSIMPDQIKMSVFVF